MSASASLFDPSPAPVLPSAAEWVTATLLGSVAAALCVIAVALVGLMLMSGRLALRDALRVVVGCFVLLGAPLIAAGLRGAADDAASQVASEVPVIRASANLPPASYDPYAGASLRNDAPAR
jgi:type IV secretory pathway VirB2 component (pilin)